MMKSQAITAFENTFGEKPELLIRSPGRVNLIGEHTDYNDGFVFPMAIDYAIWLALTPTQDQKVTLYSSDFGEKVSFNLTNFKNTDSGWLEYVKGVASCLQEANFKLSGWKGCILSNLPIGAGLSSSAALEMAVIKAFAEVSGFSITPQEMALLGQKAENEWVGMNCGVMDQLASACGVDRHALFIDCRSLELEPVPLPQNILIAILDTSTPRKLVTSNYNTRREQCETASWFFGVPALRDLTLDRLQANLDQLDQVIGQKALHIVTENNRVLSAVQFLKQGDMKSFGRLLYESHESLRDQFEVSSPALDLIVESALESIGCLGARMTGAGFGGCAVALVEKESGRGFTEQVMEKYRSGSELEAKIYLTSATGGTELV